MKFKNIELSLYLGYETSIHKYTMKKFDYTNVKTEEVVPYASAMIESFRSVGYTLGTSIADIIDNSISAGAKNIYLDAKWMGDDSYLYIKDDGKGMNGFELIEAMRAGSKNPLAERSAEDLGRFGLGLKTATFSQCRQLTVLSKSKDYSLVYQKWDLDHVKRTGNWELLNFCPEEFKDKLDDLESGTFVLWQNMDRIIPIGTEESDQKLKDKFYERLNLVEKHIALIFHQFIEDDDINIYFFGEKVEPLNPFFLGENATQCFPEQTISNHAKIKGYVLPHKDKLSNTVLQNKSLMELWNGMQGFFIYRNKRLLVAGDWLGLGRYPRRYKKEEHVKLARIRIDICNSVDEEWKIDIKKSTATPPIAYCETIEAYANEVRKHAIEVFRHRGKILTKHKGTDYQPLWLDKKRGNKIVWQINRDHSLITQYKIEAKENPEKAIDELLRFIEETIPVRGVYVKQTELEEEPVRPFEGVSSDLLIEQIQNITKVQKGFGRSIPAIKSLLSMMTPFDSYPELIETYVK